MVACDLARRRRLRQPGDPQLERAGGAGYPLGAHRRVLSVDDVGLLRWRAMGVLPKELEGIPFEELPPATQQMVRCPCRCHTSMSSAAASPVKTSPTPARVPESTANARVFGGSSLGSLGNYDPDTSSLKTSQLSLLGDSTECLRTLPRAGSMQSGIIFQRRPLAPLTGETGSGLLPTPDTGESLNGHGRRGVSSNPNHQSGRSLEAMARTGMWPTPTASEGTGAGHAAQGGMNLRTAVQMWPTPASRDWKDTGEGRYGRGQLPEAVREEWATPTAHPRTHTPRKVHHGRQLANEAGGALNPTWVEWLMGFPLGWTDLARSETP
jgi:hypothetical protein